MILENDGCICRRCSREEECLDCRSFRDMEKTLAHLHSQISGKQDIRFQMRICECPRMIASGQDKKEDITVLCPVLK